MRFTTDFGISGQAMAVLAMMSELDFDDFFDLSCTPWYNGRERGVCFQFIENYPDRVCYAVFEHRNSDIIGVLRWEDQVSINPPTIESHGELAYPTDDKHDLWFSARYGDIGAVVREITEDVAKWRRVCG